MDDYDKYLMENRSLIYQYWNKAKSGKLTTEENQHYNIINETLRLLRAN